MKDKKDFLIQKVTVPTAESEKDTINVIPDEDDVAEAVLLNQKGRFSPINILVFCIVIPLACFHLYTAYFGVLDRYFQVGIHWMGIGTILILTRPYNFKIGRVPVGKILDWTLIVLNIVICIHMMMLSNRLVDMPGSYTQLDIAIGVLMIPVEYLITYKVTGKILPIICTLFILYAFLGHNFSGYLSTTQFSFKRIVTTLYVSQDGMFGSNLMIPARYLFLFLLFGAIMTITGVGQFFVDLANSVVGRIRGGPAQAAVYSSMLMGMVSGSGPANVATTGTFTIPLMKKTGYSAADAGAVEAVASAGGMFMPPIMGQAAFLMSQMTGIEYVVIATAAAIPACLYYFCLSFVLYFIARRDRFPKPDKNSLPKLWPTFRSRWYYIAPVVTIIYFIYNNYSPQKAVFYAIIAALLVCLLFERKRLTWGIFYGAVRKAAISCGPMASCCMMSGVIMSMINLTGLGLKISTIISTIAGGNLMIVLILTAFVSLLLGMGMPASAAYVVLAILLCPAIINMGVPTIAAHLFVLMFGVMSSITPPVAMSIYTASGIAKCGVWECGGRAIRFACVGFLVPFIFCFDQSLLLMGTTIDIVVAVITAMSGCVIMGTVLGGWFIRDLNFLLRLLLVPCAIALFVSGSGSAMVNIVGFIAAVIIYVINYSLHRNLMEADIERKSMDT
ncbi:MAG: TRAP transporter fused permease subunit [Clostridiales bacterium]|nr:TRAP transporter fused permease subunit [Clostridiales bacterium]